MGSRAASAADSDQPGGYKGHLEAARTFLQQGDLDGAFVEVQAAGKADPTRYEAPALAAVVLVKNGRLADARSALWVARRLAPLDKQARLDALERLVDAAQTLGEASSRAPSEVRKLTGTEQIQSDELMIIIDGADKATTVPDRKGYLLEFLEQSQGFATDRPDSLKIWTLRAAAGLELNRTKDGWEAGQQMLKLKTDAMNDPKIRHILASLDKRGWLNPSGPPSAMVEKALADIHAASVAIATNPAAPDAYWKRGNDFFTTGDNDRAISDYSEVIRISPNFIGAYYYRGFAYGRKGDLDHAIADFTDAIRLNPNLAEVFQSRGLGYGMKGDWNHAITDYTEAIRLKPSYAEAYYDRGDIYARKGDLDHAIADYTEAIRLNPKFQLALNALAWRLATSPDDRIRNGAKALEYAKRACELPQASPFFLGTLAAAYAETGDFTDAVKWETLQLKANLQPSDAEVARRRLRLYQQNLPYRDSPKTN